MNVDGEYPDIFDGDPIRPGKFTTSSPWFLQDNSTGIV